MPTPKQKIGLCAYTTEYKTIMAATNRKAAVEECNTNFYDKENATSY